LPKLFDHLQKGKMLSYYNGGFFDAEKAQAYKPVPTVAWTPACPSGRSEHDGRNEHSRVREADNKKEEPHTPPRIESQRTV